MGSPQERPLPARRRYGEVEPRPHAGRIGAERHLDERTELGEGDDLLHPLVDLAFAEAEIELSQLDILAAGELRVDAEAAAEQLSDLPFDRDRAGFRYIDAGK